LKVLEKTKCRGTGDRLDGTGGLLIDRDALKVRSLNWERCGAVGRRHYGLADGYGKFNINSPKQLNDVLFGKLA